MWIIRSNQIISITIYRTIDKFVIRSIGFTIISFCIVRDNGHFADNLAIFMFNAFNSCDISLTAILILFDMQSNYEFLFAKQCFICNDIYPIPGKYFFTPSIILK